MRERKVNLNVRCAARTKMHEAILQSVLHRILSVSNHPGTITCDNG